MIKAKRSTAIALIEAFEALWRIAVSVMQSSTAAMGGGLEVLACDIRRKRMQMDCKETGVGLLHMRGRYAESAFIKLVRAGPKRDDVR